MNVVQFQVNAGDAACVNLVWNSNKVVVHLKEPAPGLPYAVVVPAGGGFLQDTPANIVAAITANGLAVPAGLAATLAQIQAL
jgi:hypothetical protein